MTGDNLQVVTEHGQRERKKQLGYWVERNRRVVREQVGEWATSSFLSRGLAEMRTQESFVGGLMA